MQEVRIERRIKQQTQMHFLVIFAPHILQVKVITPMERDEFGRPIPGTGGESWQDVCKCRCDDVSAEKKVSINGVLYDFKYKVVFDKPSKVEAGTEVRFIGPDGSIRGVGVAKSPLETNYFSYRVIWLE